MPLLLRVLSAVLLIPVVLATLYKGGLWYGILVAAIYVVCALELTHMVFKTLKHRSMSYILLAPLPFLLQIPVFSYALLFVVFFFVFVSVLSQKAQLMEEIVYAFSLIYLALGCYFIYVQRVDPFLGDEALMLSVVLFSIAWSNDSCAYFAGRLWGKRSLAKHISPKKTWEGALGGAVGGLFLPLLIVIIGRSVLPEAANLSLTLVTLLALLGALVLPLGDLIESSLKRVFRVKDSGKLIPGHGGVFDRMDSLIAFAPIAYIVSRLYVMASF